MNIEKKRATKYFCNSIEIHRFLTCYQYRYDDASTEATTAFFTDIWGAGERAGAGAGAGEGAGARGVGWGRWGWGVSCSVLPLTA